MSALASLLIWKLLLLFVSLNILRQAVSHFAGLVQKFKFGRPVASTESLIRGFPFASASLMTAALSRSLPIMTRSAPLAAGARVNRTRMTRIERIEVDLFGFYPR
jgi:hypothetical protein